MRNASPRRPISRRSPSRRQHGNPWRSHPDNNFAFSWQLASPFCRYLMMGTARATNTYAVDESAYTPRERRDDSPLHDTDKEPSMRAIILGLQQLTCALRRTLRDRDTTAPRSRSMARLPRTRLAVEMLETRDLLTTLLPPIGTPLRATLLPSGSPHILPHGGFLNRREQCRGAAWPTSPTTPSRN